MGRIVARLIRNLLNPAKSVRRGVIDMVEEYGMRRGLLGGSRAWLAAGVAAWVVRAARKPAQVVYRTELEPGQQVVIDHLTETARDLRRKRKGRRPTKSP